MHNPNEIFALLHKDLLYGQLISPDLKSSTAGVSGSSSSTSSITKTPASVSDVSRSHTSAAVGVAKASEVTYIDPKNYY